MSAKTFFSSAVPYFMRKYANQSCKIFKSFPSVAAAKRKATFRGICSTCFFSINLSILPFGSNRFFEPLYTFSNRFNFTNWLVPVCTAALIALSTLVCRPAAFSSFAKAFFPCFTILLILSAFCKNVNIFIFFKRKEPKRLKIKVVLDQSTFFFVFIIKGFGFPF